MGAGLVVLLVAVVGAAAFGTWRRLTDGRIKGVGPGTSDKATRRQQRSSTALAPQDRSADPTARPDLWLDSGDLGAELGRRATLVQFSTAFCQPCRATRRILGDVAAEVEGVAHVELDAESHLDLVRRLDVLRTPTVFILDDRGRINRRAVGAPRKADVIAALGEAIP